MQLQDNKISPFLMMEQSVKKVDSEYVRNGTGNIFFAGESYLQKFVAEVTSHRKGQDLAMFLRKVAGQYSHAKKIHLVMDNLKT